MRYVIQSKLKLIDILMYLFSGNKALEKAKVLPTCLLDTSTAMKMNRSSFQSYCHVFALRRVLAHPIKTTEIHHVT